MENIWINFILLRRFQNQRLMALQMNFQKWYNSKKTSFLSVVYEFKKKKIR